jgi:uncharacterized protein (DUF427 family)
MVKAMWGGTVIAESQTCEVVEGNQYFPPDTVKKQFLKPSNHKTECPWKGTAHYYHVEVDGMKIENGAWYYPQPKPAAAQIKDHIAFWRGVRVEGKEPESRKLQNRLRSLLKMAPSCMTKLTRPSAATSLSGSPETAITSA